MKLGRLISLLVALTSLSATARGEFIYFDEDTGFGPFSSGAVWTLRCDSLPAAPALMPVAVSPRNELIVMAQVWNLRGAPGSSGSYVDASGRKVRARRPGLRFVAVNERGDTLLADVASMPADDPETLAGEIFTVTCSLLAGGTEETYSVSTQACGNSPFHNGSPAVLSLEMNPAGHPGALRIAEGASGANLIWESSALPEPFAAFLTGAPVTQVGLAAMPGGLLEVRRLAMAVASDVDAPPPLDPAEIAGTVRMATDQYSGYWQLLDFTTDDSMLRPGGEYVCALIPDGAGGYRLIYLSGATRNVSRWAPGMVKAELRPAAVPGAFRARWYDAEGMSLDEDCAVQMESSRLLTVQFPHLGSTLRMNKIRPPKDF